jgi:putative thioredoxin
MPDAGRVFDVTEADFEQRVLEQSKTTPVLVDFWAPWCGPCRALGPLLEKLADAYEGRFVLAKVNVDENPFLAEQFGVSGIPAVFLVVDGVAKSQFSGALPETQIRQFLDHELPTEADRIANRASSFEEQDPVGAQRMYEQALLLDDKHGPSLAALAEFAAKAGDVAKAKEYLAGVEKFGPGWERAERAASLVVIAEGSGESLESLAERSGKQPWDMSLRKELGVAYAAAGQYREALETLLAIVEQDRDYGYEHARPVMLDLFKVLGAQHELSGEFRRRLSSVLY